MQNLKIGIVCEGYPYPGNFYQNAFIHARSKLYMKYGNKVKVFVLDKNIKEGNAIEYSFEGVNAVRCSSKALCEKKIKIYQPDILCFHAPKLPEIIELARRMPRILDIPIIIWIHGQESLLYPLFYPVPPEPRLFISWAYSSIESPFVLKRIRTIFKNIDKSDSGFVVFVSRWMKKAAEKSIGYSVKNFEIIPNPVDTSLFHYIDRAERWEVDHVKKVLISRNFNSFKYGVDIAIKAFSLAEKNYILHVYGKGRLINFYRKLVQKWRSHTIIYEKFISHEKLPHLFKKYYLFLSPSRTEAQGLTMCEFMATGGPVVATKVGGIPEFVRDGRDGILIKKNDYKALWDAVVYLLEDENTYRAFSKNARTQAENLFSHKIVVKREIDIMKKAISMKG